MNFSDVICIIVYIGVVYLISYFMFKKIKLKINPQHLTPIKLILPSGVFSVLYYGLIVVGITFRWTCPAIIEFFSSKLPDILNAPIGIILDKLFNMPIYERGDVFQTVGLFGPFFYFPILFITTCCIEFFVRILKNGQD